MSQYMRRKQTAERRKRKREEEEETSKQREPPKTSAERVRAFRKRKKLKAAAESDLDRDHRGVTAAAGFAIETREPMPGRSTDPVRFYDRPDPVQLPRSPGRVTYQAGSVMLHGEFIDSSVIFQKALFLILTDHACWSLIQ